MSTLPGADWIYYVSAGALALIALPLLYLALFRDRPRGRLRCPKCWYDMRGVATDAPPPFTCPECGTVITTAKRLHRTRRRWGWASLAVLLILLSTAAACTPKVRRDGFWSLWPTRALWLFARTAPPLHWTSLDATLAERATEPGTTHADLIWFAEYLGAFHVRDTWVKGVPLHVTRARDVYPPGTRTSLSVIALAPEYFDAHRFWDTHENWWFSPTLRLAGPFPADAADVQFMLFSPGGKSAFRFNRTVRLVDSIDAIMTPVPDNTLPLAASLHPRVVLIPTRNHPGLMLTDQYARPGTAMVYGLRAELIVDGRVIGVARWHQRATTGSMLGVPVFIRFGEDPFDDGLPVDDAIPPSLESLIAAHCTVRFTTDEEMALADLDATHYWRGTFTIPLQDLVNAK